MNIVVLEPIGVDKNFLLDKLKDHDVTYYENKTNDEAEMIQRAKDAEILIIANNPVSKNVLEKCPQLKMISVAFIGVDHIPMDYLESRNIIVSNAKDYCLHAVSELALSLTLNILRNIKECDIKIREGKDKTGLIGNELYNKTFGIIGTGSIGMNTAKLALAFGCNVVAYSRSEKEEAKKLGIKYVSMKDLMKESDIISIHLPLTDKTKHFINKEYIDLMKKNAILINTARGPIVDNAYLKEVLEKGLIRGVGIDVFDIEPPLTEKEIYKRNSILTPHIAYTTKESIIRRSNIVIDNIQQFIDNNPINVMNKKF